MWSTPWKEWRKCTSYTNRIVGGSHRIGTNIRCAWCCNKWIRGTLTKTRSQRNRVKRVKWAKGSYIRLRWFGTQFWKVNKENTIKPDMVTSFLKLMGQFSSLHSLTILPQKVRFWKRRRIMEGLDDLQSQFAVVSFQNLVILRLNNQLMQGIHFGTGFWDELETLLNYVNNCRSNEDEQWKEK